MPFVSARKRVTKAGRGAHAIYLPKAWLDAWSPEQAERAEIDLVSLDEHLILSPVFGGAAPGAVLTTDAPEDLLRLLLSAYVSGHRRFTVHRPGGFDDLQLMEARRYLRLLDERLEVDWDEERLHFDREPPEEVHRTVGAHLDDLCNKVLEAAESLVELLEFFPHNPHRALHAVHLVATIERDDIQRIKNQSYRQVARLHVPAERVADLQLLMLASHTMARMGKLLLETACTIGDHLGIARERLHYPVELLEQELGASTPSGAVFRGFLDQARHDLQGYVAMLRDARHICRTGDRSSGTAIDGRAALDLSRRAQRMHDEVADHLMDRVSKAWGPALVEEDPAGIYRVVKVHVHVQDLLREVRTLADRVVDFRLAATMGAQDEEPRS